MIRVLEERIITGNVKYIEAAGISTDSKPTANIATGSLFLEVNTGDIYAFEEGVSPKWDKVAALGGGS